MRIRPGSRPERHDQRLETLPRKRLEDAAPTTLAVTRMPLHADTVIGPGVGVAVAVFAAVLVWNTRRPAAVELSVHDDQVEVRMLGWDVVFCCRRRVVMPIEAVAG